MYSSSVVRLSKSFSSHLQKKGTRLIRRFFPGYYTIQSIIYQNIVNFDTDTFEAPLNPYKVIWIEPNQITEVTRRSLPAYIPRDGLFGTVMRGNWDTRDELVIRDNYEHRTALYRINHGSGKFENTILYKSFQEHFVNDVEWECTELYDFFISGGYKPNKYCENPKQVKRRLERYDDIYNDIMKNGYKTQDELGERRFPLNRAHEIVVDIGRNGELLLVEGRHRLAISKILDIKTVPVTIYVRHQKWMERRDQIWKGKFRQNHPDCHEFV